MADTVRNEAKSVRKLKAGVEQYAGQLRAAMHDARHEMAAARRHAADVVQERRSTLRRAEQQLARAQAELACCQENCGGLQRQAQVAAEWVSETKQQLARARKAEQLVADAESALLRSLQRADGVVGEQGSVASAALASLDGKLSTLGSLGAGHALHNCAKHAVLTAEIIGATTGLGRAAGDALQAANVQNVFADDSLTEMVDNDQQNAAEYVLTRDEDADGSSDGGTVTA